MTDRNYRHEFKYLSTERALRQLEVRLNGVVARDSHVMDTGRYLIRSVYFDDLNNSCYRENEDGADPREKFRIRIYNADSSRIALECKQKYRSMTHKDTQVIDRDMYDILMGDDLSFDIKESCPALVKKVMMLKKTRLLAPKIIVQYERIPFICNNGNVRITFDMNISASKDFEHFFEDRISTLPVLCSGQHLLEVKYDAYLPDYIKSAIDNCELNYTTFSKYYLCRKAGRLLL